MKRKTARAELAEQATELLADLSDAEALPKLSAAKVRELQTLTERFLLRAWPTLNDRGRAALLATGWAPPN
jgi:hypothetical protein